MLVLSVILPVDSVFELYYRGFELAIQHITENFNNFSSEVFIIICV